MALNESEVRVLAILGLVILILWSFFGLLWSFLLVFTFLIYAYNFGRHGTGKIRHEEDVKRDVEPDHMYQEKLHDNYQEPPDLAFTGLRREQFSLSSPMPLVSESVTKRLSFNMSSATPFQARKAWYHRELVHTPFQSRGNAFTYRRKPNNFSLLNRTLQKPTTVKIASPDVMVNRTFTLPNSPLKRAADDWNPCSRFTVLSALKESRKRSFVIDDEEEELTRPTKRRDTKPVDSYPYNSPILGGRKRAAIPRSTEITSVEENSNKKSKVTDHRDYSDIVHSERQSDSEIQKRKEDSAMDTETTDVHRVAVPESIERTTVEDNANKKSKVTDHSNYSEIGHSEKQADSTVQKRKADRPVETKTTECGTREGDEGSKSKKAKSLAPQAGDKDVQGGRTDHAKGDASCLLKPRKRFTVPRFASKEDSRRRAVPVYCASNEESDMPQRRTVPRKINQEQIKIDRRLAWERVKELLDDDEEEEEEQGAATKSDPTAVLSTAATTSASSFKIPTAGAVTSAGTITTTTTQSLITPAPATGDPQRTAVTCASWTNPTVQANAIATQSQASAVPSLPSQQVAGSILSNILRSSTNVPSTLTGGLPAATANQGQSGINTTCTSGTPIQSQANVPLTSTVSTSQGPAGFQFSSSSSSFRTSPFTKPAPTKQLTSLSDLVHKNTPPSGGGTDISSAQKAGFNFTAISSSAVTGSSSNTTAAGQGGFNFTAPSGTQNAFSLGQNTVQNAPVTNSFNSPSTFVLGASTSQKPATLGSNNLTAPSQNLFGSLAKPVQTSSVSSASSSPGVFGQSANTPQSSFGSATQNKVTFGVTNMQAASGQRGQSPFGGSPFNASGFGAKPAQNAAVSKGSTQSPFAQGTFGAQPGQNASQSAFGNNPTQNAFGAQQNQNATPSVFGGPTANSAFSAGAKPNPITPQGGFGAQKPFGAQKSTTQGVFGSQATQNAFGSQPNQTATQSALGTQPTQNAFGVQLNQQATQSAFGAPANQKAFDASKSSPFSFGANTAQNATNSSFGGAGFGNKAGTPSTFGAAPSQNASAPSGGFNFGATGSNSTPGGFNFSTTSNKTAGFQFGGASGGGGGTFAQFGQTTAQPATAPATPAPSGGFNFGTPGPGGMPGSPFVSPAGAPAFGVAPSTPQQGAGSMLTAKSRARLAARRRGKK